MALLTDVCNKQRRASAHYRAPGDPSSEQPVAGEGQAPSAPSFPAGAAPDYHLGSGYEPPDAVGLVGRDQEAGPDADAWSVCYVNVFQTQPGELDLRPDEVLLRPAGEVQHDPDWPDEAFLDTSTAAAR